MRPLNESGGSGPMLSCQEIGFTHMRVLEGVGTLVQLGGLVARLCKMVRKLIARPTKMIDFLPVEYGSKTIPVIVGFGFTLC